MGQKRINNEVLEDFETLRKKFDEELKKTGKRIYKKVHYVEA